MINYNQRSKFGGGKNNRNGGGDFRHNNEIHRAICADCKKSCEVPFRPNGMKPVYCKDCFGKNGGQVSTSNFVPKQNVIVPKPENNTRKLDEQTRLLEALNTKFDKLITLAEKFLAQSDTAKEKEIVAEPIVEVKKVLKKVVSKKK